MEELFKEALKRHKAKADEHNSGGIEFEDYCIYGDMSAADFIHREATRVCAMAERGDVDGMKEHLVDVAVFAGLMWDRLPKNWEKSCKGICPNFLQVVHYGLSLERSTICKLTNYPICSMWWSMCQGTGEFKWNRCSTYLLNSIKKGEDVE